MSSAFHWFIILGTFGSLLTFCLILYMNRHVNNPGKTTGHNYDGIEEYDNPMPAWWFWGFIISIVFAIGYLMYYPGLGNFKGVGNWTQISELRIDQADAEQRYDPVFAQYRAVPVDDLLDDLSAMRMGRRLFSNNCAVCHGSAGTGSEGFPNLTDNEWMWGDSGEQIKATIAGGRNAMMPAWGAIVQDEGVTELTEYVLQLAGRAVNTEIAAAGEQKFGMYCTACHGPSGAGLAIMGAPDLTNETWLYGNSRLRIEDVIRNGRNGQMPAFTARLGEDKVHILSAYVKSLARE